MTKKCLQVLSLLASAAVTGIAQTAPAVPSLYQATFTTLSNDIANFDATVQAAWDKSTYPVLASSQLLTANSSLTTSLLKPNYYQVTVLSELNSLQALGNKSATFHVSFPALYPGYYSNPADYQSYVNFYTQLVGDIRARGMKVIVEATISNSFPGTNAAAFSPYYQSLDWPTYCAQRAQQIANVAQLLRPDYLVMVAEPDTEATTASQPSANTVGGSTQMVQQMIAAVQAAGVTGVKLGAGSSTWNPNFLNYIQSFSALPLDFVDMHVYPVNLNNLPNAMAALSIIQAAGKQPSMSEFWAYKESDSEYSSSLSYTTVYARDAFSFWSPVDIAFLQTMRDLGNYGHFAFMSPFWSRYMMAYLDYNVAGALADATIINNATAAASQASISGVFTPTGLAYENLVIGTPDTIAPVTPAPPTASAYSQIAATLQWTPAQDNVGVAAYNLYRNNVLVTTANSVTWFTDTGLSPNTTYTYTLVAFDASGNLSQPSAPLTITTYSYPDTTAPSVPVGVKATAASDVLINLSWNPSTDNVAVFSYEIYRGTSPTSLVAFATSTTPAFADIKAIPAKTYYYQIDAFDAAGNHSARSAMFSATALADTNAPTTPGNVALSAAAGPAITLTWTASADDYMVSSYQIYRGTTASNMLLVGYTAGTQFSYVDTHVTSGKTYYYAIAAGDPSKNLSPQSAPMVVTAP